MEFQSPFPNKLRRTKSSFKSTEKETQKAILEYLEARRIFCYRQNTGGAMVAGNHFIRFGTPGAPDIVAVIRGQYVGIEVKGERGYLNDNQKAFKERLEAAGGKWITARTIDDIIDLCK